MENELRIMLLLRYARLGIIIYTHIKWLGPKTEIVRTLYYMLLLCARWYYYRINIIIIIICRTVARLAINSCRYIILYFKNAPVASLYIIIICAYSWCILCVANDAISKTNKYSNFVACGRQKRSRRYYIRFDELHCMGMRNLILKKFIIPNNHSKKSRVLSNKKKYIFTIVKFITPYIIYILYIIILQ